MRTGGWRCGGPGRATGDTARVYTSAGDCIEGVSSAGGVKSISSSKWSSNSCANKNRVDENRLAVMLQHNTAVHIFHSRVHRPCPLHSMYSLGVACMGAGGAVSVWPPARHDSHLEVDLPFLAAGHTVHQQHHQGHERRQ